MQEPLSVKLVIVGDGVVGKTCILSSFVKNEFPKEYVPTIFDNTTTTIKVQNRIVNLSLWDTAGQEQYNHLRALAYPNADIFLIIFSVVDSGSFINAKKKWIPEIEHQNKKALKYFIGNKIDLRSESGSTCVSKQQARIAFEEDLHFKYLECSALTKQGLKETFQEPVREIVKRTKKELQNKNPRQKDVKGCCQIM